MWTTWSYNYIKISITRKNNLKKKTAKIVIHPKRIAIILTVTVFSNCTNEEAVALAVWRFSPIFVSTFFKCSFKSSSSLSILSKSSAKVQVRRYSSILVVVCDQNTSKSVDNDSKARLNFSMSWTPASGGSCRSILTIVSRTLDPIWLCLSEIDHLIASSSLNRASTSDNFLRDVTRDTWLFSCSILCSTFRKKCKFCRN